MTQLTRDAIVLVDPLAFAITLKDVIHRKGYQVICLFTLSDKALEGPLKSYLGYVDRLSTNQDFDWVIRESHVPAMLAKLKEAPFNIRAIIPGSDYAVLMTDHLAMALGLPHNDPALAHARRDKSYMKEAAKKAGLRCADFKRCRTEQDVLDFMSNHDFPVVLKTPAGGFTSDVHLCHSNDELIARHRAILSTCDLWGHVPEYTVLESFVGGTEYAVNLFADGTDVHATDIWCYEKAVTAHDSKWDFGYHAMLQPLDSPTSLALAAYASALAKALGQRIGPAHAEIKYDEDGPIMIEIGTRLAGGKMPAMVREFSNFDPVSAMVDVFLEGRVQMPRPVEFRKSVAIGLFPTESSGKLKAVVGLEQIAELPSYHSHFLNEALLDPVKPTTHVGGVPLITWLAHESPDVVRQDVARARSLFRIECM
jgi:biotin carboxylase